MVCVWMESHISMMQSANMKFSEPWNSSRILLVGYFLPIREDSGAVSLRGSGL